MKTMTFDFETETMARNFAEDAAINMAIRIDRIHTTCKVVAPAKDAARICQIAANAFAVEAES